MLNSIKFPTYEEITKRVSPSLELSPEVLDFYRGQIVLLTGAGGSIGSRIAKQLSQIEGLKLVATDRDENALHSLSLDLASKALFDDNAFKIMDVRDNDGIRLVIDEFKPSIVIHAAALKHLSVLESQPREALLTNCIGTSNLVRNANNFGVEKFLNISTDKAANPSSILGKSKLYTEKVINYYRENGRPNYTNVRFGNVFASKGSVIQTFCHQIANQTSITLTDPKMKRYFMNIDEAAFLAITSLKLNSGQTHLLDMGEAILMVEIINSLQNYFSSNLPIQVTGARPGEKFDEDLSSIYEDARISIHEKIRVLSSPNHHVPAIEEKDCISDDSARVFLQKVV
jgi:FlaA1/EpsC-like NDP-sugar epimerase